MARLTSLPSVAPTMTPVDATTTTTSGSGLFHCDTGLIPASTAWPTAAMICDLVKISASGPMPTSRYCDHQPFSISLSFNACASGEPGTSLDKSSPIISCTKLRTSTAAAGLPRAPLDHPLQHGNRKCHAGGFDGLQVDGRQQPGLAGVARVGRRVGKNTRRMRPHLFLQPPWPPLPGRASRTDHGWWERSQ